MRVHVFKHFLSPLRFWFTVKYIIQNIDDVNFLKHSEIMFVVLYVVLSLKNPSNNVQSIVLINVRFLIG